MAKLKDIAEALTILARYDDSACGFRAEHDEVYAGPDKDALAAADLVRLDELGWTFDSHLECWRRFV